MTFEIDEKYRIDDDLNRLQMNEHSNFNGACVLFQDEVIQLLTNIRLLVLLANRTAAGSFRWLFLHDHIGCRCY